MSGSAKERRFDVLSALKEPTAENDADTGILRKKILKKKKQLQRIYDHWYAFIQKNLPQCKGAVLELGSGAGYLDSAIPGLIKSDISFYPDIHLQLDARALPFRNGSLRAIVMTDVFHHIPDAALFLEEAENRLCENGRIIMIEPWVTKWSSLVYRYLHHEPFLPDANNWAFDPSLGPLYSANSALPWIVFHKDAQTFKRRFNSLNIMELKVHMPLSYLITGGFAFRPLLPDCLFERWLSLENRLPVLSSKSGMFASIVLEKITG